MNYVITILHLKKNKIKKKVDPSYLNTFNWSLSLVSTSRRRRTGSVNPASTTEEDTQQPLTHIDSDLCPEIHYASSVGHKLHIPARANSTSSFGRVAENRSVCRVSGSRRMISWSCSAKPISNSLTKTQDLLSKSYYDHYIIYHNSLQTISHLTKAQWWAE